jgi:hypothetical protein
MDFLKLLKDLGLEVGDKPEDLTDEQITEALAAIRKAGLEAVTAKDAKKATELAAAKKEIDGLVTTRAEEAATLSDLEAQFAEKPAEEETPAEEEEPETPPTVEKETVKETVKVEAAAKPRKMPVAPPTPTGTPSAPGVVVRASAELKDLAPGSEINDPVKLSLGFANKADSLLRLSGNHDFTIARGTVQYPEAHRFTDSRATNMAIMEPTIKDMQATTRAALQEIAHMKDPYEVVKAALSCNPAEVSYDVLGLGSQERPLRDSLNRKEASRGGVEFMTPYTLANVDIAGEGSAVTVWNNDAVDPADKTCQLVDCGEFTTESVDAIAACMDLTNFNARYFPESGRAFWNLILTAHARIAEQRLYDRLAALATGPITFDQSLGTFRDVVEALVRTAYFMRSPHRVLQETPVRFILPDHVPFSAAMDLFRQMPGDDMTTVTTAKLVQVLAGYNIAVTFSPDIDVQAAGEAGVAPRWPTTIEGLGFFEGTVSFLDGGRWDFGMEIRDTANNAQNRVRAMIETAEGLAFFGTELRQVAITTCPSGETAGTVDSICTPS